VILAAVIGLFAYAYWLTAFLSAPPRRSRYRRRDGRPVYGRRPSLAETHTYAPADRW
jgi:hypothetical protein